MLKSLFKQTSIFMFIITIFCRTAHSDDPKITWINPVPTGIDLCCAASNGITTLVAGGSGLVMSTTDFKKWQYHYTYQTRIVQLLWTGKVFLAVCSEGPLLSSPDGCNWNIILESRYAPENQQLIQYKNGTFYLLTSKKLYISTDQKKWKVITFEGSGSPIFNINQSFFTGSVWYSFGTNKFFTSTDCIHWIRKECEDDYESHSFCNVKSFNDTLFGLTEKNHIQYFSKDSIWSTLHNGECKGTIFDKKPTLFDFVKIGDSFIAIDFHGRITHCIGNSPWEIIYEKPGDTFSKIVKLDNKRAIVLGADGCMVLYKDHKCTNLRTSFVDYTFNSGASNLKTRVIVGDSGTIYSSDTAGNLIRRTAPFIDNFEHAIWTDKEYLAFGSRKVIHSKDGILWEPLTDLSCKIEDVLYSKNTLYAVGDCILSSSDGTAWENHGYLNYFWQALSTNDTQITVISGCNSLAQSPYNDKWTISSNTNLTMMRDVIWTGKNFVALGQDDIYVSPGGGDWKKLGFSSSKYVSNWNSQHLVKLFRVDSFTISPNRLGLCISKNDFDWYNIYLPLPCWNVNSFIEMDTLYCLSRKGGIFKIENIKKLLNESFQYGKVQKVIQPENYLKLNLESSTKLVDSVGRINIRIDGVAYDSNRVLCTWSRYNEFNSMPYQSDLVFNRNDSIFIEGRVINDTLLSFEKPYLLLYEFMKPGDTWKNEISVKGVVLDSFQCTVDGFDTLQFYGAPYPSIYISTDNGKVKVTRCFSRGIGLVGEKTFIKDTITAQYRLLNNKKLSW
jgi:hypothetical protein